VTDPQNAALNGKVAVCAMNPLVTLAENQRVLQEMRWAGCSGSLVPLLVPAESVAVPAPEAPAAAPVTP